MEIITACKWHNCRPEDSRGSERKHNKNITGGFFGSLKLILKSTVLYTKAKVKIKISCLVQMQGLKRNWRKREVGGKT